MSALASGIVAGLAYGYRPAAGPLQRLRVEVALVWFAAVLLAAMVFDNPLAQLAVLVAVTIVAARSGALARMRPLLALAAPIALLAAVVNALVVREGLTVWVEGAWLPLLGTFDITREAVVYGLVLGLRAFTVVAVAALYVVAVDPDEVLRMLRRFSVRSAITATLASRLVPLLARDATALAEARRCRPGRDPGTSAVVRSVFARSFERTEAAALALELRGYSHARRAPRPRRALMAGEWLALGGAVALALAATVLAASGVLAIDPYPRTRLDAGGVDLLAALALMLLICGPVLTAPARRRAAR